MNKRLKAEEVKQECARIIGYNTCFVCDCIKSKKGMTVHHLEYVFYDITYNKYKPSNDTNKLAYYTDLLKMVKDRPERFMFLCNTHHQSLERLNRFKPTTLVKLLEALLMTKTNPKYKGMKMPNFIPRAAIDSKFYRIKELQPLFAIHNILIKPEHVELESELTNFKDSDSKITKDLLDALYWANKDALKPSFNKDKSGRLAPKRISMLRDPDTGIITRN